MERSLRVLHHGNRKIRFSYFKTIEIEFCPYPKCLYPEKRNPPGFVNISLALVIDASMEWSSLVLQHGNPKIGFFSKKFKIEF